MVIEDPRYPLALNSLLAHGARVTSGRTDNDGLIVSELQKRRTKLALITPSHSFLGRRDDIGSAFGVIEVGGPDRELDSRG